PGKSCAFCANSGARVTASGARPENWSARLRASARSTAALAAFIRGSSNAAGSPVWRDAASARPQCPSWTGLNEPERSALGPRPSPSATRPSRGTTASQLARAGGDGLDQLAGPVLDPQELRADQRQWRGAEDAAGVGHGPDDHEADETLLALAVACALLDRDGVGDAAEAVAHRARDAVVP